MRILFLLSIIFLSSFSAIAQEDAWFYLRARDTAFVPTFEKKGDYLIYSGNDARLKAALKNYKIMAFKKTWKHAKKENLKKTFFVISDNAALMQDLLRNVSNHFEFGELIAEEDKKIFEPNDYGLTSTIGKNLGVQRNFDYLDFLEVPKAWYYTTGSRDIIIGISDGTLDPDDIEFAGKTKIIQKSVSAKGHGMSTAEIAAGQGNNGFGAPGICYDCSIYGTNFLHYKNLVQLLELSKLGVKVINCSWGVTRYYETAQQAIYEMMENGTVVVAIGHNTPYSSSKGKEFYYPASYDKVIAVSSASHRYEHYTENIQYLKEQDLYYVKDIRYYVGQTGGFKNNDTTKTPDLYPISVSNLNSKIDILGPGTGLFLYGDLKTKNNIVTTEYNQTSIVAPVVSGTVGLMFSLYPCLPAEEVESIIKFTSTNIDDVEPNKPYAGMYGAGMLNTGRAVEMVFRMFAEKESVKIENQRFSRWDFKLTSITEVILKNQQFTENATLDLTSKKQIVISENTVLKPNASGKIHLKIDPTLKKECELRLRDPSILKD
ncbi:subtilisin-like serine protease [Aequorivita sublithincola DSM 14238]|uniref:Subtilisin-like serine protease n=1 Tax=Aequorivita sublithincola (strain DSM 14238 / LMG 21431 / ACAM 643 / 9-3) TaxID=746697 RepID=I3YX06_AEQSU|nr:S8/S53 family peptidase [Aequorivita sublithincola]AFL81524.1 subtilisin-like serine protease [Aequorivita sublithincola DSM 14238]